jgi:hypothetical protein
MFDVKRMAKQVKVGQSEKGSCLLTHPCDQSALGGDPTRLRLAAKRRLSRFTSKVLASRGVESHLLLCLLATFPSPSAKHGTSFYFYIRSDFP